ncbi:MAG: DUF2281 domain-containing protein [Ignavibacteriaceae bacterium]
MENKRFYNKFESLPMEAQKQVIAFIDFLKEKYKTKNKKSFESNSFSNKKFVGIWKDRTELEDSSSWVKSLRNKEWKENIE